MVWKNVQYCIIISLYAYFGGANMNILLVEDERIQRVALASIIKSNFIDVRIYEAASQAEAIKIINEKDIHLFFIDIQLKDYCTPALFHHNMPVLFHKIRLLYLRYDGLMPA